MELASEYRHLCRSCRVGSDILSFRSLRCKAQFGLRRLDLFRTLLYLSCLVVSYVDWPSECRNGVD